MSVQDAFRPLPHEIIIDVLIMLDSQPVRNLRLASRAVSMVTLSGLFWQSRFWPGREFEHLFEFAQPSSTLARLGRRDIYRWCALGSRTPGMKNRKRVWFLAGQIADLVKLRMEIGPGSGAKDRVHAAWTSPEDDARRVRDYGTAEGILGVSESATSYGGDRSIIKGAVPVARDISGLQVFCGRVHKALSRYISGLVVVKGLDETAWVTAWALWRNSDAMG